MKKLRKLMGLLICLCALLLFLPGKAEAASSGTCGDNLTWTLDAGTLTISGTGDMWDDASANQSFMYNYRRVVSSIVIEEGVTSIGDYAFYDCIYVSEVTIPDTVTRIGKGSFSYGRLLQVTLGSSLQEIGVNAFRDNYYLTRIIIPDTVTSIGDGAFANNYALKDLTVGAGMRQIGASAFY